MHWYVQDERTNQNIKRALRKYVNDNHNDWDLHLPAVVYVINTAKRVLTRLLIIFIISTVRCRRENWIDEFISYLMLRVEFFI